MVEFEVGKFYKKGDKVIHVLAEVENSVVYGEDTLIAESNAEETLEAVKTSDEGWEEITLEEFETYFY
jgi:hypothetical protein